MRSVYTKSACAVLCLALGSGCATTPKAQMVPKTATGLVELRHALASGKIHLERTSESLRDLMASPRSNTQHQIKLFTNEMDTLEMEAQRIRDINTRIQAKSDEHFEAWNSELDEIQNPEIAEAAQKRQQHSLATLEAIRATMDEARETLSPFMSNLRDIDRFLSSDQTAEGVEALTPTIKQTLSMQSDAMKQLDRVIGHIDDVTKSVQ